MKTPSIAALLGLSVAAAYGQGPAKINYNDHIAPIFRNACTNCHNPDKKKAGLDLTTYQGTMAGGESGAAVKPGNGDGSLMYRVSAHLDEPKMPPKGDKLSDAELKMLKDWIAGFALETANSKPSQVAANKVDAVVVSLTKPDGPPPMPGDLPLDPFVKTRRNNAVLAMAASPWAPVVAIGGQKQVFLYNTETAQPLGVLAFPEGFPNVLRFSRNAKLLLAAGGLGGKIGKVVMWDVTTGERVGTVGNEADSVLAADISPDHQFVAIGGPEKRVKILQTKDGKQTGLIKKHTEWITAITYSPDGKYLATADRNGGIEIWEAGAEPKPFNTLAGHKAACTALAFMPGVLASASEDGKVTLWNVKEGTEIKSWTAHPGGVQWVEFSPDGRIATCGRDKIAKVWDSSGKEIAKTEAFNDLATRCALNADRVIAADFSGEVRVYALDGKKLADLSANPPGIAEQLAAAEKALADSAAALPALEKALADCEAKVKAEKEAAEAKRKADLAAAEGRRAEKAGQLEAAKAAPAAAEKAVNERTAELTAAKEAAVKAETALGEKRKAEAATSEASRTATIAQKRLDEINADLNKRREARAKFTEGTPEYAKANETVQALKPELEKAEAAVAAAKAKLAVPATAADVEAAKTALAEARKKAEGAAQRVQEAKLAHAKARESAPKQVAELEKAIAATDAEITRLKNPGAAPVTPADAAKVAELQKRDAGLKESLAKLRDERAKFKEGSAEYAAIDVKVQARKNELAKVEEALAAAKGGAPAAPQATEAEQALAKAKADRDAAAGRLEAAKAGITRWKRAQLYQTVFNARTSVSEKQAKYEDLVATAKDAFRAVEMTKQAVAAAEKTVADGPKLIAEKDAARAAAQKVVDDFASQLAAVEKQIEAKKNEVPDPKVLDAEIVELQKQINALGEEREKLKNDRTKFAENSPEFKSIQAKRDDLKNKQTPLEAAIAAAKKKKELKPGSMPVPPELAENAKKLALELKLAKDKLEPADKALADARKTLEEAKAQIPQLKARIPVLQAEGVKVKAQAEKAAASLAKELQAAKAEADRLRAQYEASKKTADASAPKSGKLATN